MSRRSASSSGVPNSCEREQPHVQISTTHSTRRRKPTEKTYHRARDPTAIRVALLAQVDVVELEPQKILLGRLEVLALSRVALDLCDRPDWNLGMSCRQEGRKGGCEGYTGVVGECEVDVVAWQAEELDRREEASRPGQTYRRFLAQSDSSDGFQGTDLVPDPSSCNSALDLGFRGLSPGDKAPELVEQVAEVILLRAELDGPVGEHHHARAGKKVSEKRSRPKHALS